LFSYVLIALAVSETFGSDYVLRCYVTKPLAAVALTKLYRCAVWFLNWMLLFTGSAVATAAVVNTYTIESLDANTSQ